jgi:hypothetical protein
MTRQYLIGELSLHLQQLQAVASQGAGRDAARDISGLRRQAETGGLSSLGLVTHRALALADRLCWESLSSGDIAAFMRQAEISADLRLFGTCARLLEDPNR